MTDRFVFFNHSRDSCNISDVVDETLNPFRLKDGTIRMIGGNGEVGPYSWVGPSLLNMTRDCENGPVIRSRVGYSSPGDYPHKMWLPATYTDDGVHVHGLVHDEYHARASEGAPASQCPSQVDNNCWYSSLLAALSTDGGATFSLVPGVGNSSVVVAAPFPYVPDAGTQGVPAHRHIVQSPFDGYFYTMPNCAYLHQMKRATGKCVWRTDDLTAPTSWRAWNGTAWGTRGVNPYVAPPSASMMPMYTAKAVNTHLNGGLTFVQAVGEFVIVGSQTNEQGVVSIMYQSSRDLVSWSPARVLLEIPLRPSLPPTSKDGLYPTMLDPSDPSRNFDHFGQTGHIYWTEFDCQSKALCWRRNVVRYPLAVKSLE